MHMLKLYLVTDSSYQPNQPLIAQVEAALKGGVTCVQYREKNKTKAEMLVEAQALHALTSAYKIPLIINDYPEIAKAVGAEGIHLGQEDGAVAEARAILGNDAIIGVTAKTVQQAEKAYREGANYLGVGAVFTSTTKATALPITHDVFNAIHDAVPLPIVAIGGITQTNILELRDLRFNGIAVVSALLAHEDVKAAALAFHPLLKELNL